MTTLLNLIAAIALLVWGTHIVRTGVLRVYGAGLRQVLRRSMNGQATAFLAGLGVTGLLQSSTATALLTSSFVAQGLLTTAGRLLFGGDPDGNFVAYDVANGNPLWHAATGQVSNAPETYMVDGRQYVLVAAGDTLFAFTVNP